MTRTPWIAIEPDASSVIIGSRRVTKGNDLYYESLRLVRDSATREDRRIIVFHRLEKS